MLIPVPQQTIWTAGSNKIVTTYSHFFIPVIELPPTLVTNETALVNSIPADILTPVATDTPVEAITTFRRNNGFYQMLVVSNKKLRIVTAQHKLSKATDLVHHNRGYVLTPRVSNAMAGNITESKFITEAGKPMEHDYDATGLVTSTALVTVEMANSTLGYSLAVTAPGDHEVTKYTMVFLKIVLSSGIDYQGWLIEPLSNKNEYGFKQYKDVNHTELYIPLQ